MAYRKDYCSRQNTVQCNPEEAETESTWRSGLILRDAPINLQSFDQSAASWESIGLESYLDKALENIQETIYRLDKEKLKFGELPPGTLVATSNRDTPVNLLVAGKGKGKPRFCDELQVTIRRNNMRLHTLLITMNSIMNLDISKDITKLIVQERGLPDESSIKLAIEVSLRVYYSACTLKTDKTVSFANFCRCARKH